MVCERIALPAHPDPALLAKVVALLRAGRLCVLPTETVYGLSVIPSLPHAVAAARELKGRDEAQPFTFHLADRAFLEPLAGTPPPRVQRLVDRYWPGPLTLILTGRDGGTVGVRVPAHAFTRAVIAAIGEPLWMTSVNRAGEPPLADPDAIVQQFGDRLALLVDDKHSLIGSASTIVRATGPALEVLREGILTRDEILRTAAAMILFVCTGNTCRSPLAEAIARVECSRRLGVAPHELLARGLRFVSAGTGTDPGAPASAGSTLVAAELGLDLAGHQSQVLDRGLALRAAKIYCLGASHLRAVHRLGAEFAAKAELLHPEGKDIPDPWGAETPIYRVARDAIAAAVAARADEWLRHME
jgi:protein-tyrosine phosphatase